ncbi:endonuclease [Nocardioides sp. BGMRC 2183]|nr:endonuclease [Nocardioides sp. BGMRC 2183]
MIQPDDLLAEHGTTFAEQAGITLRDKPSPLYQLLVLTTLLSAPISADVAAATARELFTAGWRTPARMRAATWQQRVDALGRGGYRRYDESTADYLEEGAARLEQELSGDLRRLRPGRDDDVTSLEKALQQFPRVGPTGAAIFCREVQAVWPGVRPYFDERVLEAAQALGYPQDPGRLAELVQPHQLVAFAAALERWSRS